MNLKELIHAHNEQFNLDAEAGHDMNLRLKIVFSIFWERIKIGFKPLKKNPDYIEKMIEQYESGPYQKN